MGNLMRWFVVPRLRGSLPWIGVLAIGMLLASMIVCTAVAMAVAAPERYMAKLDPPKLKPRSLPTGELTGFYVYVYVGGERVVCANPFVWDGPKIITCDKVVTIDEDKRPATGATGQAVDGSAYARLPPVRGYDTSDIEAEHRAALDLIAKRMTFEGRNAERGKP